jgi:hypothetical protein
MTEQINNPIIISIDGEETQILEEGTMEKDDEIKIVEKKAKKSRKSPKKKIDIEQPKLPITLYEYQIIHKERILNILENNPFALDLSMLGTGKTYTTSYIFNELKDKQFKHLISIAPVSVKSKWKNMESEHGICLNRSISFCELRSVKFKQHKHGLLYRKDYMAKVEQDDGTIHEIEKCDFTCTPEYLKLVEEGVMLVIDEIQNIKNISNQLEACKELIRPIVTAFEKTVHIQQDIRSKINVIKNNLLENQSINSDKPDVQDTEYQSRLDELEKLLSSLQDIRNTCKSRILLLSGSPMDKEVQVVHFFKTLNIMKHDKLAVYNPQKWDMMWRGMEEIEDYHRINFNASDVLAVRNSYGGTKPNHKLLHNYCYKLFNSVFKKYASSAMIPESVKTSIFKRNAFYTLGVDHEIELLVKGVTLLSNATRFNISNNTVDFNHDGLEALRGIQRALLMIETAKIGLFYRIADSMLNENPNTKIVICVNYTATVEDLMDLLSDWSPLRMDGSLSAKQRGEVIKKFQSPNNDFRVLIGNVYVLSTGIDLDDQHGNYPRLCLVSPNYSTITLYQLSHRFQRAATKSDATIHFTFCKEATELAILNALAKKSNIMKEITDTQVKSGVVFPGDYDIWEEPASLSDQMSDDTKKKIMTALKREIDV